MSHRIFKLEEIFGLFTVGAPALICMNIQTMVTWYNILMIHAKNSSGFGERSAFNKHMDFLKGPAMHICESKHKAT